MSVQWHDVAASTKRRCSQPTRGALDERSGALTAPQRTLVIVWLGLPAYWGCPPRPIRRWDIRRHGIRGRPRSGRGQGRGLHLMVPGMQELGAAIGMMDAADWMPMVRVGVPVQPP